MPKVPQMRIGILKLRGRAELRQNTGTHFNVETFCPLDVLARAQNIGVPLQSSENGLIQIEARNARARFRVRFGCRSGLACSHIGCQQQNRHGEEAIYNGKSHDSLKGRAGARSLAGAPEIHN